MKTKIGAITLEILTVAYQKTETANIGQVTDGVGDDWHSGLAMIEWVTDNQEGGSVDVNVTCWTDTDDDGTEWCAANEGANAISRCFGGAGEGDSRGSFARAAYPRECEDLGREICRMLRKAANKTPYPMDAKTAFDCGHVSGEGSDSGEQI